MLTVRRNQARPAPRSGATTAPPGRPGARTGRPGARGGKPGAGIGGGAHPLVNGLENAHLHAYEDGVKAAFGAIVPTLKEVSALQHEADFERQAQALARTRLGFGLPDSVLADAWVQQVDMRRLFAWCVFETYTRFCDEVYHANPLASDDEPAFQAFLQECGFHTLDVSPCADGRLAHVIRYVLRLPYRAVRRKSYAGALFDIEDSLEKWVEVEFARFREGRPNTADEPTRYLKVVVYHHSSSDPAHEGCAAHGSDNDKAARAGLERLQALRQAVENTWCCGASVDLLLVGLDTDTDTIRVHVPNGEGEIDPEHFVDAGELYDATRTMSPDQARSMIEGRVAEAAAGVSPGMARLVSQMLINNFSQIEYVRNYHGGCYGDIGHAERFIGTGIGFEEVQLRNLTYFAYMSTVEEAAPDLDVGIKIFTGLNIRHGLPVPVVVRFDYHGKVPGARERAVEHCQRVNRALAERYEELVAAGMLHTLQVTRDVNGSGSVEVLESTAGAGIGSAAA